MTFSRHLKHACATLIFGGLLALGARTAQAGVYYNFTIGPDASGFFTVGAASSVDPGFSLITGIDFTRISGTTQGDGAFLLTNQVVSSIVTEAAYNPTTGNFINHFGGNTYPDSGTIATPGFDNFGGLGSGRYDGNVIGLPDPNNDNANFFILSGPLVVKVPEPGTLTLFGTGIIALALVRRRNKRSRAPAVQA